MRRSRNIPVNESVATMTISVFLRHKNGDRGRTLLASARAGRPAPQLVQFFAIARAHHELAIVAEDDDVIAVEPGPELLDALDVHDRGAVDTEELLGVACPRWRSSSRAGGASPLRREAARSFRPPRSSPSPRRAGRTSARPTSPGCASGSAARGASPRSGPRADPTDRWIFLWKSGPSPAPGPSGAARARRASTRSRPRACRRAQRVLVLLCHEDDGRNPVAAHAL